MGVMTLEELQILADKLGRADLRLHRFVHNGVAWWELYAHSPQGIACPVFRGGDLSTVGEAFAEWVKRGGDA